MYIWPGHGPEIPRSCFWLRLFPVLAVLVFVGLWPLTARAIDNAPPTAYVAEQEFRLIPPQTGQIKLAHGFIEAGSCQVLVDGKPWVLGEDYRLKPRSGAIVPLRRWSESPAGKGAPQAGADSRALVMIRYRYLPVPITTRLDLRPLGQAPSLQKDPTTGVPLYRTEPSALRTGSLVVSGSKTVQVSSGTQREMTVDQNLRLSISGQLTRDISVRAFLSDDNLPVVPEGNTEELRDIDKVLVELRSKNWQATLGDFVAQRSGTLFGNYRRKLQGVSVQATPGSSDLEVLAGSPRGLYRTLQIRGQEANQGPYYLGGNGSSNLFVVAGSERVTLDNEPLTRGEDRDYTIDYVRGTVTFTYRRLITAESTIVVEFEEGEGPYGRTVVGGGGGTRFNLPLTELPTRISARVIREKDDPSRLRTGELGDDDTAILRAAGDDPLLAIAPGVVAVEPGSGLYDQILDGGKTIYVYNPLGGDYNLSVFYVGPDLGDYALDQLTAAGQTIYIHKGDGQGSYLIGRPLAMPESQTVMTLQTAVGDTTGTHLAAEWNVGNYDRNQLSELDGDDNKGSAGMVVARVKEQTLHLGGRSLGRVSVAGHLENRGANFNPFMVHKTIFSYDEWGLADRARRHGFMEEADRESGLEATWSSGLESKRISVQGRLGALKHGADLSAEQVSGQANWTWLGGQGRHQIQSATAVDGTDPLDIARTLRRHSVSWKLGPIVPSVDYNQQKWIDDDIGGERASGFQQNEIRGGLRAAAGQAFDWRVNFQRGLVDSLYSGNWQGQRDSRTWRGGMTTGSVAGMRLVGEGTVRKILQPDGPEQVTRLARINLAGKWLSSGSDWSLGYRVDNSRTEVLDGQIVFVGEQQGDYNQDGEFVGKGQGDYNLIMVATDSLIATTSVEADLHWRQDFSFLGKKRWYGAWSSMTLVSVGSRSTIDDVGALLRLNPEALFDRENTVLADLNLSQELVFLKHVRTLDLRGKFDFRQTRDRQFVDHPEDRVNRILMLNGNVNVSDRSSVKLGWRRQDERRYSTESGSAARRGFVSLTRQYELGWNYRPGASMRLGLQAEYITRGDQVSGVNQTEYALRPTGRRRIHEQWTLQAEVRLAEVISDEPAGSLRPWFYGYPGRNVESSLRLAWDPTQYLSVAVNWFTRKQGDRRWQHDLRVESTARF